MINKYTRDTSLQMITDMLVDHPLIGRILGYGEIDLLTASEAGTNKIRYLPDADGFKKALLDAKYEHEMEVGGGYAGQPGPGAAVAAPPAAAPAAAPADTRLSGEEVDSAISHLADLKRRGLITDCRVRGEEERAARPALEAGLGNAAIGTSPDVRCGRLSVAALLGLAAAVTFLNLGPTAGGADVPPLATSSNVHFVTHIPGTAAGMNFKDHYAYVSGWTGIVVLDIAQADFAADRRRAAAAALRERGRRPLREHPPRRRTTARRRTSARSCTSSASRTRRRLP